MRRCSSELIRVSLWREMSICWVTAPLLLAMTVAVKLVLVLLSVCYPLGCALQSAACSVVDLLVNLFASAYQPPNSIFLS